MLLCFQVSPRPTLNTHHPLVMLFPRKPDSITLLLFLLHRYTDIQCSPKSPHNLNRLQMCLVSSRDGLAQSNCCAKEIHFLSVNHKIPNKHKNSKPLIPTEQISRMWEEYSVNQMQQKISVHSGVHFYCWFSWKFVSVFPAVLWKPFRVCVFL